MHFCTRERRDGAGGGEDWGGVVDRKNEKVWFKATLKNKENTHLNTHFLHFWAKGENDEE
jgi:hypothetical protein